MYDASDEWEEEWGPHYGDEVAPGLHYKAHNMIGATGSRHVSQRRRASIVSGSTPYPSLIGHLEQVSEEGEGPIIRVARRRAVDTSDLRTCALLQGKLKEMKTYPEMATFQADSRDTDGDYSGDGSMRHLSRRAANLSLPGMGITANRSLFIFSEDNFIRKYAKIIIEWGYPFSNAWLLLILFFFFFKQRG
ncbi:voltage-dependent calcium channel type A subunit alpha-1-like [Gigantopelta aegis]|uniref:voltage-dependent calcium channel type A subunit alpha-1-like n=1 Tax=Gigantopelta aegis TaxID=1735272 RepID=UPI001B8896B0|nr:voltage-dependent calcium channel type A subunit alpha-1-like [Gigantopelta aegis]